MGGITTVAHNNSRGAEPFSAGLDFWQVSKIKATQFRHLSTNVANALKFGPQVPSGSGGFKLASSRPEKGTG